MCRFFVLAVLLLTLPVVASAQAPSKPTPPDSSWHMRGLTSANMDESMQQLFQNLRQIVPGSAEMFRIGDTFFGGSVWLRWPDKRVNLDVRNAGISEIAKSVQEQTGIEFVLGDGVPSDLKITIHVTNMRIREFLGTLTSTTGLIYVPESHAPEGAESAEPKKVDISGSDSGLGGIPAPPSVSVTMHMLEPQVQLVTRVTILNPRTEGIVVNMGRVSTSLKNADPIEAVTTLINQIKGANYVVLSLNDYLKLQSPEDEAKIKQSLKKASRPKVTLELRNVEVADALTQLSSSGKFYITIPKPGTPSFLIIPDVVVTNAGALPSPPISYWSTSTRSAREQEICIEYTKQMAAAILKYAKENGDTLPDASNWITLIPVRNEYLDRRMPSGRYQYSYGMNQALSGMKLSAIRKPSQVVLIFESDSTCGFGGEESVIRTQRHPGGIVYGFADGSVRILTEKPNFKP